MVKVDFNGSIYLSNRVEIAYKPHKHRPTPPPLPTSKQLVNGLILFQLIGDIINLEAEMRELWPNVDDATG